MTDEERFTNFRPKKWRQFFTASVASEGALILGTVLAWSSPALPDLVQNGSQDIGEVTGDQATWIASLAILGALFSALPGGYAVGQIGTRRTILLLCLPLFLGWLQIIFADSIRMIYFGRFVIGFFSGVFSLTVPVYIGEIAEDRLRGQLGSLFTLQLVTGILLTYIGGAFLSWRFLSMILAIFPVGLFIGMYFMPESPTFLLSLGKEKEAAEALRWLRGATDLRQIEPELKLMKVHTDPHGAQNDQKLRDWLSTSTLKPLLICVILMIIQQWSGIGIAIIYTVQIFRSAGSTLSANTSTILVGVAQVVGVTLSTFLIDRLGRRILLILSCLSMIVCLVPLGLFYYVKQHFYDEVDLVLPDSLGFLPLVCLVMFMVVFSIGLGPVPWMLPGELMAPNFRAMTGAIATTFYWLAGFILSKIFDDMAATLGLYSCYWIFAGVCLGGGIFVHFVLPETKQKSYDEIALHFKSSSSSSSRMTSSRM